MEKVVGYKGVISLGAVIIILWFALVFSEEKLLLALYLGEAYEGVLLEIAIIVIAVGGVMMSGYYDHKKRALFGEAYYEVAYFRQPYIRVIYGVLSGLIIVVYVFTKINDDIPLYILIGFPEIGIISAFYGRYYYNEEKLVVQNWEITIDEIDDITLVTNDFGRKLMFTAKDRKKAVDFVNGENQIRVYQWISGRLAGDKN